MSGVYIYSRQLYGPPLQQYKEGTCGKRLLYFEGYEDIRAAPDPAFGLRWSKSSEQHG